MVSEVAPQELATSLVRLTEEWNEKVSKILPKSNKIASTVRQFQLTDSRNVSHLTKGTSHVIVTEIGKLRHDGSILTFITLNFNGKGFGMPKDAGRNKDKWYSVKHDDWLNIVVDDTSNRS